MNAGEKKNTVLVAAEGISPESGIAKRLGHSAHFLKVDVDTLSIEPYEERPGEDHHAIIRRAASEGISTVVTANIGPKSFDLLLALNMNVALARDVDVRTAVTLLAQGKLRVLETPTLKHNVEDRDRVLQARTGSLGTEGGHKKTKVPKIRAPKVHTYTLRQLGGRGH